MATTRQLRVQLELIGWLITAVVAGAILYPIVDQVPDYRFLLENALFIVLMITFTRYIFLLRHTWLASRQRWKIALLFLMIPTIFWLVNQINVFQTFLDENGPDKLVGALPPEQQVSLAQYIRSETILFGVGAVIAAGWLAIRLLYSVWRWHNRDKA